MEETASMNKESLLSASSACTHDHRKRKKDADMPDENDGIPRPKLGFVWTQDEQDVSITTKLGAEDGEPDKVEVTFTEQQMTITLSDGYQHHWCFHGPIDKDQSRVQRKKRRFHIKVVKKETGMWPALEAPENTAPLNATATDDVAEDMSPERELSDSSQEVRTKEEEPVLDLQHIKHDFFERDEYLTIHIYVKNVPKDAVKIHFDKQSFTVKFQTSDVKFLQLHSGASEDTVFCWKVNTKNPIQPGACKHKTTTSCMELTLKKASLQRWAGLEAPIKKESAAPAKASSWIPVSGAAAASSASQDNSAVAFDEMSQVDLNRRDSDANDMSNASQLASSSYKTQKPTAKVQPLNKQSENTVVSPGYTGLENLGNTCFMNSVIQVLSNTREIRDFFLGTTFQNEINRENVLGSGGQLAVSFGVLLRMLWKGTRYSCAPSKLKELVAHKAPQFHGYQQHDSQEFLAFLLDGLHEDLNRVKVKPYTIAREDEGRPDHVVADEAWEAYKKRNDSFVVDLLQGQYKSKLVCPVCSKVSITFDPFLYLSVPIPKKKKVVTVTFMWRDPQRKPVKFTVQLVKDSSVQHLKEILARKTAVHPKDMRVFEVFRSLFHKRFVNHSDLIGVQPNDIIIVSEVMSAEAAGEEVVEVEVIQRTITAHQYPSRCSACHKECKNEDKLKRCTKCLKVGYCDTTCQRTHWQIHRAQCSAAPEPVGSPFILSLPHSLCTYSSISRHMENFARYSVDTFQPPVKAEPVTPTKGTLPPTTTTTSSMDTSNIPSTTTTTTTTTTSSMPPPPPPSTSSGDLQLPPSQAWAGGSSLSSSSSGGSGGSQSSGSLSSLDSISSCSSTATLTAETPHHGEEDDDEGKEVDERQESGAEDRGAGDTDSGIGSVCSQASCHSAEGDRDLGAPPPTEKGPAAANNIQSVAASVTTDRSVPLFFIKPVSAEGRGIRELDRLDDKGEEPLDMSAYRCLSMDWRNSEKLASYVLVQSKPLESETDDSMARSQDETGNITLKQCLELFTEPEVLTPNEAWYCPGCKAHREASKQMSVWRLPHTLIIQLKRFAFRNIIMREKIDKEVEFPVRGLDMSQFTRRAHRAGVPAPIYDLYGVVNHHGSLLGGHYTAYTRCADLITPLKNEVGWRLCDDSRVTSLASEKSIMTKDAYLLFYRLRQPFTPPSPTSPPSSSPTPDTPIPIPTPTPTPAGNLPKEELAPSTSSSSSSSHISNSNIESTPKANGAEEIAEEKRDSEKEDQEIYDSDGAAGGQGQGQGRLVMDVDSAPPLDYTDMDAVD